MPVTPARMDWGATDLVVFDVDGTLYGQARLRAYMLVKLATEVVSARNVRFLRTLVEFRRVREALANEFAGPFVERQYVLTAERVGLTPQEVRQIIEEWIQIRPLPLLARCKVEGVNALFHALRRAGKIIAILSDYPADAKLDALDLQADIVMSAMDKEIDRLKPDPTGLRHVLHEAGVPANRAVMIGDRIDRDAEVARRVGMRALVRSRRSHPSLLTFRSYHDAVFAPFSGGAHRQELSDLT